MMKRSATTGSRTSRPTGQQVVRRGPWRSGLTKVWGWTQTPLGDSIAMMIVASVGLAVLRWIMWVLWAQGWV